MKMRTVEITVGGMMIAGVLSLLMLALQVSGLSQFTLREEKGYRITAEFSNVGGLKPKAKVSLGGVVVGRVLHIGLEPETFNASVLMIIDPKRVDKLPDDTRASILTAGLLGDNYISLTPGFSNEFLKEHSVISVNNTDSAVILEQLVSKFLAGQVGNSSNGNKNSNSTSNNSTSNNSKPQHSQ